MASLNQATLIGYVGDAPKINQTKTGRKVASLSVATTEKGFTKQDGSVIPDRTEWHNVILWGKLAEIAEKYIRKGSMVFVQGKMRTRSYDDAQGVKKYITEIECDTLQLLDRRTDATASNQQPQYSQPQNFGDDGLPF